MKFKPAEWYAIILTVAGLAMLGCLLYIEVPEPNQGNVKLVIGYLMGTVVTTAVNFMIGTSKSSQDKTDVLKGSG